MDGRSVPNISHMVPEGYCQNSLQHIRVRLPSLVQSCLAALASLFAILDARQGSLAEEQAKRSNPLGVHSRN